MGCSCSAAVAAVAPREVFDSETGSIFSVPLPLSLPDAFNFAAAMCPVFRGARLLDRHIVVMVGHFRFLLSAA
jgi:hypothetical protein